jgi:RNA polymerase sigma factor (sigma-70 family)
MTDGELLARFVRSRDDDALAALMRRHAPMVWGVCRRLLNHHDAEDAFQATFLVLVRKAAGVPRQAVANWLYGVARQTAVRLRATAAKRGRRERQVVNMPEPTVPEVRDADLQSVVDEELSHLPYHYRGVIVLCDLEGMTRKEAARQLGIPEGSVASRLARARALLAKRLNQRGVVFSGGSVAVALSAASASASAPSALVASTIKAASLLAAGRAAGVVSAKVAALTEGVVKAMFMTKMKGVLAGVLVVGVTLGGIGAGVSLFTNRGAVAQQPGAKPDDVKKKGDEEKPMPDDKKVKTKVKADIEWGKAAEGLQAGIAFRNGEPDVYLSGQSVNLHVFLRNIGDKEISVSHIETLFEEWLPTVADRDGKKYKVVNGPLNLGLVEILTRKLSPGQTIRLGTAWFVLLSPGVKGEATATTLVAPPGKYVVSFSGFPLRRPGKDSDEQKWPTGEVEIEIGGTDK